MNHAILTNRQHGNEVRVDVLESDKSPITVIVTESGLAILWGKIEPGVVGVNGPGDVVQVGEAVETVGAEIGINVVNVELAFAGSAGKLNTFKMFLFSLFLSTIRLGWFVHL